MRLKTRRMMLVMLVMLAAFAAGCAGQSKDSGSTSRRVVPLPLQSFARQWATDLNLPGGDRVASVHVRDETIFVYTSKGFVTALSRADGHFLYVNQVRGGTAGGIRPPVVLKEWVIIPTLTTLEVFDRNGYFEKSVKLNFAVSTDAVGSGESVYLAGNRESSGRAAALDLTQKYVPARWELLMPRGASAAPALVGDAVYFAGKDGNVYAVAGQNRAPIWEGLPNSLFHTDAPIVADLWGDESGVYVAAGDTRLYCLNRDTGVRRWQYFAGRPLTRGPVGTAQMVYLPLKEGVAVFDKSNGDYDRKPKWIARGTSHFLAEDDTYSYLRRGTSIVAYERSTGLQKFTARRNDLAAFGTNIGKDGIVYAATTGGQVIAIRPVLKPGEMGEVVLNSIASESIGG